MTFDRSRAPDSIEAAAGPSYRIEVEPHHCFVCGDLNLRGLRATIHASEGRAWTELTLEREFEGWEGVAHGGIVAALLDEVMTWALHGEERLGVTVQMQIRFRAPTPIGRPVRAEGWVTEAGRRRMRSAGRLTDTDGRLLATSEATYLPVDPERQAALERRYRFRVATGAGAGEGRR